MVHGVQGGEVGAADRLTRFQGDGYLLALLPARLLPGSVCVASRVLSRMRRVSVSAPSSLNQIGATA